MRAILLTIFCFLLLVLPATLTAQEAPSDSTVIVDAESVVKKDTVKGHSPRKAVLLSAVVPGAGQIYNKKAWKVPIIYAGLGAGVYFIAANRAQYLDFKDAYVKRVDEYTGTVDEKYAGIYTDQNLFDLQETYRRWMELSYIGTAAFYVLQLVDATVDAHLFEFDVSNDLTLDVRPSLLHTPVAAHPYTGFTLKLKL